MWLLYAFSGPLCWAVATRIDKFLVGTYFRDSDTAVLMVFTALLGAITLPPIWLFDLLRPADPALSANGA